MAAWTNAALFAVAGLINLGSFPRVREIYVRWDVPAGFYRAIGLLELVAAVFLLMPDFRAWGLTLSALILFGSVVMLLNHRHYTGALAVMAMLVSLVPGTMLAIPPSAAHIQYAVL